MVLRYRPEWLTPGGPGVSTFHFLEGNNVQDFVDGVRLFFSAIATLLPDDVTVQFPAEVEDINDQTGELTAILSVTPPASVTGSSTSSFAAPAGARVRWVTGAIVRGRRVIGTTFLVPITSAAYQTDGSLGSAQRTTILNAANALRTVAGASLAVWSRPSTTGGSDGSAHGVISASVPEQVAILRSRRD